MGTGSGSRGITETDVWQAADALLLEGARPTIERVRQKVGRGSPNTVSPYLDTWFKKLGARIKDPMAFSAPPEIPDPVHQAALHFWEAALATARARVTSEFEAQRVALEDERRAATEERAALAAERKQVAEQVQARDEVIQVLRGQLADAKRQIEEVRVHWGTLAAELTAAREAATRVARERDALRERLDAQRAAHEKVRTDLEARAQAHEKRWTMEVDRAREALKTAQSRAIKSEKDGAARLDKVTREWQQAAEAQQHAERSQAAQQAELIRLRREADAATKRESVRGSQIERLQTHLSK